MARRVEVDTKTFVRFWLVIVGLAIGFSLLSKAATGLLIVGLSIFLAVAIRPLERKVLKVVGKERHAFAAGITVGGVVLVIGVALAVIGPTVVNETTRFLKQAPEMLQQSDGGWDGINEFGRYFGIEDTKSQIVTSFKDFSQSILSSFSTNFLSSVTTIGTILSGLVLTIILAILWLVQGPDMIESLWKKLDHSVEKKTGKLAKRITYKMANVISKYVSGQVSIAFVDAAVVTGVVALLGVIFNFSVGLAFPMGLIALLFYLIPMFGQLIACIIITLVLFISSPAAAATFLIVYTVYGQIEANVIAPKVQGDALELSSLIILISITIGMYAFGLIGAIISIPIAGMIKVLVDELPNIRALRDSQS